MATCTILPVPLFPNLLKTVLLLFQAVAEYSGCRKEQPHIKFFWQALRDFTPQERSMLIKFTWGRSACSSLCAKDEWLNVVD